MKLCDLFRIFLLCAALCAFSAPAMARGVAYEVKKQSLDEVVDTLSDLSGIAVVKAGGLKGSIENWRVRADGVAVFEALARDAGLFMAFDGSKVILASRADVRTTALSSGAYDWATVQRLAKSLFPIMPDDALQYDSKTNVIIVRAPPSVTEVISGVASRPNGGLVRIIKGGNVEDVDLRSAR